MIEIDRLVIKPLTYDQLLKYIRSDNSSEKELALNFTERTISPELKEALEKKITRHLGRFFKKIDLQKLVKPIHCFNGIYLAK